MAYTFNITGLHKSIIKVIGVGGGGSNAVNHMYNRGIKEVEFVVVNTDKQALNNSPVPIKIQIGVNLTEGLGAGANPQHGKDAALENREEIRELLSSGTKMVFITAGMGGGTGTGAAPVIAQIARDLDILTVAIITFPANFEGTNKMISANAGIEELRKYCDTVLIISNEKIFEIYEDLPYREAYNKADDILATAAKSIAEIITVSGHINVDFKDVQTVMKNSGTAVIGSARAEGEGRALKAIQDALNSPLLDNRDIKGAKKVLFSIMAGRDAALLASEIKVITNYLKEQVGSNAEMIHGIGDDDSLGNEISVTVIATGFGAEDEENEKKDEKAYDRVKTIDLVTGKEIIKENPVEFIEKVTPKEDKKEETIREFVLEPIVTKPVVAEIKKDEEVKENVKKVYQLDDPQQIKKSKEEEENIENEPYVSEMDLKGAKLIKEAEERKQRELERLEREKKLKSISTNYTDDEAEEDKKRNEPTFKRTGVQLHKLPDSSEKKISKFNLNEDNQILGNNKFFHDKPD